MANLPECENMGWWPDWDKSIIDSLRCPNPMPKFSSDHSPESSGAAKPISPVVTPHFKKPLFLTSSSVPAFAEKAKTETAKIDYSFFILFPLF